MNEIEEIRFDQHATQEILRLAGEARKRMDLFTADDLVRAAAEIDIPASAIHQAEQIVRERQSELDDRGEFRRVKVRETWKFFGIGVPVIAILVLAHSISLFNHVFSILKGFMKGLSGLFFAKSTGHEMEFQTWRNKRFYLAEYGSSEPAGMLSYYFKEKDVEDRDALIDWLVVGNGVDPTEATKAVQAYEIEFPIKVVRNVKLPRYPSLPPPSALNTDIAVLARRMAFRKHATRDLDEPVSQQMEH